MAYYEVETDQKQLLENEQEILNSLDKPVKDIVDKELIELKATAMAYQKVMGEAQSALNSFRNSQKRASEIVRTFKNKNSDKYKEVKEYQKYKNKANSFLDSGWPQRIIESVLNLQVAANKALGQEMETVFVFENAEGKPELYRLGNIMEFLKYGYTSKTFNLNARFGDLKREVSQLQASRMDDLFDESINLEKLDETYKEILLRYRQSKIKTVMWLNPNPPDKWHLMRVAAGGDINEAYAAIVLQRLGKTYDSGWMEQNIEDYMEEVGKVDNISGLLEGDVTVGNMEYAIKSAGASILGISQFNDFAKEILKDDFDLNKLKAKKEELHNKGQVRNILQSSSNIAATKQLKEEMKRLKLDK